MPSTAPAQRTLRIDAAETLAAAASHRLRKSPYFAMRKVHCRCEDGRLMLSGRLSSYFEKQIAQEAVARLDGVVEIVNAIEVEYGPVTPTID